VDKTYVPNVLGMPLSDAVYLLENYGLKVVSQGSGKVISQSINPGVILVKGKVIQLVLG
jgi:cell division protein FtsI (penicillin-binding protein 3)